MTLKKMSRVKLIAILSSALIAVGLLTFGGIQISNVINTVTINGVEYDKRMSEINLSGSDLSANITGLFEMKNLKTADLTNTNITPNQYEMIAQKLPDCHIKWSVPMGGTVYSSDVECLTLNQNISPVELEYIKYFKKLKTLDARGYLLCDELYNVTAAVSDSDRGYDYLLQETLCGVEVTNKTTELDLSNKKITDVSEFYEKLRFFPDLAMVYVGDCKVSDEEMDKLNRAFPNNQIVWLVEFGRWQVRTDIKVFSTLVGVLQPRTFWQDSFYPLLNYCTELRALDLGHNKIYDLNGFSKLTKLEILLLPDAYITDLSGMKNFPNLHYVEMFNCSKVTDLAPLGDCANLQEIEMQNLGKVKNLAALQNCKKLKMLFAHGVKPTDYTWAEMRENMPDCWINTTDDPAFGGWRSTDKNQAIKTAFDHWDKIVTYNSWDDVTYSEEVTLAPKHW